MRGILDTFTSMSGLCENPEKSVIWFSKRATSRDKRGVLSIFPVEYAPRTTTYLGCPISKAGYYTRDFINLKERILNKLAGWKLHTLSFAGRTELIRSVLQSMPMHVMATQLLPKKVLNDLSSIFKKFLWGKVGHNRYLALVGWEKICTTFQQGGLNIRNLNTLNISWVMKTLYNFLAGDKTTWAKVCGAKYCEGKGFWEGNYQRGNSDLWKAFHKIKHCIKADLLWIIGSGSKIPAIGQPWYPNWEIDIQQAPQATDLSVRDLFNFQLNQWRIQNLTQIFHPNSVHQIQSLKPTPTQDLTVPDRLVWKPSKNGLFSLKLAYQFLANQSQEAPADHLAGKIWSINDLQPKIKAFLWKITHHALPTMYELRRRIPRISPVCPRCGMENETIHHMLFICTVSRAVWFCSPLAIRTEELPLDPMQTLQWAFSILLKEQLTLFANIAWAVWKSRNAYVFRAHKENPTSTLAEAMALQAVKVHPMSRPTEEVHMDETVYISSRYAAVCFLDGSWDNNGRSGVGVAVYCNKGRLQHISCKPENVGSPFQAELAALQHALQVITDLQVPKPILFLSDCMNLTQYLNEGEEELIQDWRAIPANFQCRAFLQQNHALRHFLLLVPVKYRLLVPVVKRY
ncbi:hypothetical protein LUZ63_007407 [Rhynchospora breviuscula]|uniref:Uncharacterized protein n=1 Tax=Rhynchospora breviuscula TaxID=2022672 RepID=A0A9Q0HUZ2_9POAL|nr:hypothetical protein LUZ63_007407 [Rhynchospora breviuscula]